VGPGAPARLRCRRVFRKVGAWEIALGIRPLSMRRRRPNVRKGVLQVTTQGAGHVARAGGGVPNGNTFLPRRGLMVDDVGNSCIDLRDGDRVHHVLCCTPCQLHKFAFKAFLRKKKGVLHSLHGLRLGRGGGTMAGAMCTRGLGIGDGGPVGKVRHRRRGSGAWLLMRCTVRQRESMVHPLHWLGLQRGVGGTRGCAGPGAGVWVSAAWERCGTEKGVALRAGLPNHKPSPFNDGLRHTKLTGKQRGQRW